MSLITSNEFSNLATPVGLFGGSFDPVQNAHLTIAKTCISQRLVGSVVFIPAQQNPLKTDHPPAVAGSERLNLILAAIEGEQGLFASDIELEEKAPSYTYTTLSKLRGAIGTKTKIALIMGSDSLANLSKWFRIKDVIAMADTIIIYPREGYAMTPLVLEAQGFAPDEVQKILGRPIVATPLSDSATEIRNRLKQGLSCDDLLPPKVAARIKERGLYRGART